MSNHLATFEVPDLGVSFKVNLDISAIAEKLPTVSEPTPKTKEKRERTVASRTTFRGAALPAVVPSTYKKESGPVGQATSSYSTDVNRTLAGRAIGTKEIIDEEGRTYASARLLASELQVPKSCVYAAIWNQTRLNGRLFRYTGRKIYFDSSVNTTPWRYNAVSTYEVDTAEEMLYYGAFTKESSDTTAASTSTTTRTDTNKTKVRRPVSTAKARGPKTARPKNGLGSSYHRFMRNAVSGGTTGLPRVH